VLARHRAVLIVQGRLPQHCARLHGGRGAHGVKTQGWRRMRGHAEGGLVSRGGMELGCL
jgi:hypothetical protein